MNYLLEASLLNAALATVLAIVVWLVTRRWRHPVLVHTMWIIVLVKLITPPMVTIPWRLAMAPMSRTVSPTQLETIGDSNARQIIEVWPPPPTMDFVVRSEDPLEDSTALLPTDSTNWSQQEQQAISIPLSQSLTGTGRGVTKRLRFTDDQSDLAPFQTASDSQPTSQIAIPWATTAMVVWLSGSTLFILVSAVHLIRFHRALADTDAASDELQALAEDTAALFGLRRTYRLRLTEGRLPPLVWPIGQPAIVLPRQLLTELSHDEIQTLLAHELAHLRRHDDRVRWLELVVTAIYWWHPVVWWARTAIQQAEEAACDAWVVSALPNSALQYASALFKAVQFISAGRQAEPILASALGSSGELKERIEHVMNATWQPRLLLPVRLSVLVAAILVLPLSLRAVQATDETTPSGDQVDTADSQDVAATDADAAVTEQAAPTAQNPDAATDDVDDLGSGTPPNEVTNDSANAEVDPVDDTLTGPITPDPQPAPEATTRTPEKNGPNAGAQAPRIRPGTYLAIQVAGAPAAHPINRVYALEPDGYVALGPVYGRVWLGGMTVSEAESVLVAHLQTMLKDPRVQVTFVMGPDERRRVPVPANPYHIAPGDVLSVSATATYPDAPIAGDYVVEPSGSVPLGPTYGRVKVVGMTLEDAEKSVVSHLRKQLTDPKVQVTIGGWRGGATSFVSPTPSSPGDPMAWARQHRGPRDVPAEVAANQTLDLDLNSFRSSQPAPQPTQNATPAQQRSTPADLEELNALRERVQRLENQLKKLDALHHEGSTRGSSFSKSLTDSNWPTSEGGQALAKDSIGVLRKYAYRAQQDYERTKELAERNVVSAAELAGAKSDLEISVERVRQAERGLKYHQLVLEAAEADYELLLETNKRTPNTISAAELRRAKLAMELAKAKLEELSE